MYPSTRVWLASLVILMLVIGLALVGWQLLDHSQSQAAISAPTPDADEPPLTAEAASTSTPLSPASTDATLSTGAPRAQQPTPSEVPTPLQPVAPTPGPTVAPELALEFTRVRPNQYLGTIANSYGVSVEDIVTFSRIDNPDVVSIGQGLIIPHRTDRYTPATILIPDSEVVYGTSYVDFDIHQFVADQGGFLATYSVPAPEEGRWTGADLIERVALSYSVGPRVLLALIEARSGWVTDPDPQGIDRDYPLGHVAGAPGLLPQLEWAADELNRGFYGWLDRGETAIRFRNGTVSRGHPKLNPGTVAVQRVLAGDSDYADIEAEARAFSRAYRRLFGSPSSHDSGPVLPVGLVQPPLQLPWPSGEWWHLTGGPHGGWASGSGWAALDFVPENTGIGTCIPSDSWATAAAPGVVARERDGEILIDLDCDGDVRTGWVLQYLHITDQVSLGTVLEAGDPVGRPSCEGGAAETTHLHFARRYNGLWVDAGGSVPMELDGWRAWGGFEYEGGMRKPGLVDREACHCRDRERNGLTW